MTQLSEPESGPKRRSATHTGRRRLGRSSPGHVVGSPDARVVTGVLLQLAPTRSVPPTGEATRGHPEIARVAPTLLWGVGG